MLSCILIEDFQTLEGNMAQVTGLNGLQIGIPASIGTGKTGLVMLAGEGETEIGDD